GGDVVPHPVGVHLAPLRPNAIREDGYAENIVKAKGPIVYELGRSYQSVDQLFPLLRIAAGQKLTNPFGRRKSAGQIETHEAQKFVVAREGGRLDAKTPEFVKNEAVDEVEALNRWIRPEIGADYANRGAGRLSRRTHQDGGFAGPRRAD